MTEIRTPHGNKIGVTFAWDMSISSKNRPKVIVVSHERSGTHFLMNSIAVNFGYISDPWIDIDHNSVINPWAPENIMILLNQAKGKNVLNTFKSHHSREFFEPLLDQILDEWVIFYIWRQNHQALFDSFCNHLKDFPWFSGPKCKDGTDLKLAMPSGAVTRYQTKAYKTMHDRYFAHIDGWIKLAHSHERIVLAQYELLDSNFDQEIVRIGRFLNQTPAVPPIRPSRDRNVITPEDNERRLGI